MKKIDAFEMWVYRRMLRISWMGRVTNVWVLQRMNKEKEVAKNVKIIKLNYFGYIMRNTGKYQILQNILQGKIEWKRLPDGRELPGSKT